jgi:excinuclease ABC subunit B
LDELRRGEIDVLIGVNLLREGLDLPEVSLVAILDADKEGFLRSHRALTQTIGRAARNVNGTAILYADSITQSMQLTIDETTRRRMKQQQYNQEHGITPTQIKKTLSNLSSSTKPSYMKDAYIEDIGIQKASEDPIVRRMNKEEIEASITFNQTKMQEAAKNLDFVLAAQYRDEMIKLEDYLKSLSQ